LVRVGVLPREVRRKPVIAYPVQLVSCDDRLAPLLEHDCALAAGGLLRGHLEKSLKLFLDEVCRLLIYVFLFHDFLPKEGRRKPPR
jgi:hypothetical protein